MVVNGKRSSRSHWVATAPHPKTRWHTRQRLDSMDKMLEASSASDGLRCSEEVEVQFQVELQIQSYFSSSVGVRSSKKSEKIAARRNADVTTPSVAYMAWCGTFAGR